MEGTLQHQGIGSILHFHQYNTIIHFFPIKVSLFLLHNSLILCIGSIIIYIIAFFFWFC
jgi:hypothetical protein